MLRADHSEGHGTTTMSMYESFYGLQATPFRLTPDPGFFFASGMHQSAQAHLRYALNQGEGFVVVSGSPGTGKTVLMLSLLGEMDPERVITAKIVSTNIDADEMLELVAHSFGVTTQGGPRGALLKRLEEFFLGQAKLGKRIILFIDEAHHLSAGSISEVAKLANFQLDSLPIFQCFLLGQERLLDRLAEPRLRHVRQQVVASLALTPLPPKETKAYIEYRLSCAGWRGDPLFTPEAYEVIHRFTGGNPRQINVFCNRLLLRSYLEDIHRIDQRVVAQAAEEVLQETIIAHAPVEASELSELAAERTEAEALASARTNARPVRLSVIRTNDRGTPRKTGPTHVLEQSLPTQTDSPNTDTAHAASPPASAGAKNDTEDSLATDRGSVPAQTTSRAWRVAAVAAVTVIALITALYVYIPAPGRSNGNAIAGQEQAPTTGSKVSHNDPGRPARDPSQTTTPQANDQPAMPPAAGAAPSSTKSVAGARQPTLLPAQPSADSAATAAASVPVYGHHEARKEEPKAELAGADEPSTTTAARSASGASATDAAAASISASQASTSPAQGTSTGTTVESYLSGTELGRVLQDYSSAYEAGDLNRLRSLFAGGMRSNGKTGRDRIAEDYEKLFAITDSRNMSIGSMSWRAEQGAMHGQGSFRLSVREKTSSRAARYEGHIAFAVQKTERGPIITRLNFSYDE